jgi:hypothetical protein
MFVFDTSRSMLASRSFRAPTRFAQAKAAALELRDALPSVPSGIASLTTVVLPHLLPTADRLVFASTTTRTLGVERPPPPVVRPGLSGTSFWALTTLRDQGYFGPQVTHRLVVLLTDGESGRFPVQVVAHAFRDSAAPSQFGGARSQQQTAQPPLSFFVIRVGSSDDRIYRSATSVEASYRPDPQARQTVTSLAAATHGRAFAVDDLGSAERALQSASGGPRSAQTASSTKTTLLTRYVLLATCVPLAIVLWRRNLTRL